MIIAAVSSNTVIPRKKYEDLRQQLSHTLPGQYQQLRPTLLEANQEDLIRNRYIRLRLKLQQEETWTNLQKKIQSNHSLTEEEKAKQDKRLKELREEFVPLVLYFCHYSPQALLKACQLLRDLEATANEAKQSLPISETLLFTGHNRKRFPREICRLSKQIFGKFKERKREIA